MTVYFFALMRYENRDSTKVKVFINPKIFVNNITDLKTNLDRWASCQSWHRLWISLLTILRFTPKDGCWWFMRKHKTFLLYVWNDSYCMSGDISLFKWKRNGENLWKCDNKLFLGMIFLLFNVISSSVSDVLHVSSEGFLSERYYNRPISERHQ